MTWLEVQVQAHQIHGMAIDRTQWRILLTLIVGLGIILLVQFFVLNRLREENRALRSEVQKLTRLAEENQRASNLVVSIPESRRNDQFQELLRLRGEVGVLRGRVAELNSLQTKSSPAKVSHNPSAQAGPSANFDFVRDHTLTNIGLASPEAALQTFSWAWKNGDAVVLLASLSPEGCARLLKEWENNPEAMAEFTNKRTSHATGYRIVKREEISPDEVILSVYIEGEEEQLVKMKMKRFANEWKLSQ